MNEFCLIVREIVSINKTKTNKRTNEQTNKEKKKKKKKTEDK